MRARFVLATACVVVLTTNVRADRIDFSTLVGSDVADASGQSFPWQFGAASGTVNVKASYPQVLQINGAIRTPVQPPASFGSPFFGTVTLTFDQPVEIAVLATFASMTRDALDGGRFEQVQLTSSGGVSFSGAAGTTAIYTGAGTNTITADDQFPPTPPLSIWGFVGDGISSTYTLQYTGTTSGLSETFDVRVIPEPTAWLVAICGAGLSALVVRGRNRDQERYRLVWSSPRLKEFWILLDELGHAVGDERISAGAYVGVGHGRDDDRADRIDDQVGHGINHAGFRALHVGGGEPIDDELEDLPEHAEEYGEQHAKETDEKRRHVTR